MDSKQNHKEPNPKRLKNLASEVAYDERNNLLHQFVLDNSKPNKSKSANYINAILMSMNATSMNKNALNDEGYSPLHLAVLKNNQLMVKKLISCLKHIDINKKSSFDNDENTALHLAAKLGHLSIIQELLNGGADVNKRNVKGFTALFYATMFGKLDLMEILINKGADVNAKCPCGVGRHYEIQFDSSEDVKYFIRNNADLDIIDYENKNILSYSARSDPPEYLVRRRGVSVHYYTCRGLVPLHCAFASESKEAVNLLINNGADLNTTNFVKDNLLHYAAQANDVATVAFLIDNGVDVNAKNEEGVTPLHYAAKSDNVSILKFLIKNGADLKATDNCNENALHYAAKSFKTANVKILIKYGAEINVKNEIGCTPLHCALYFNNSYVNLDVIKVLVNNGADVNAKDNMGYPCLHYAIGCEHLETIKFLVRNGADLNAVDGQNQTALQVVKYTRIGKKFFKFLTNTRC